MKIRTDFITNSSSSSFVIATKEELTLEKLCQVFGFPEDHILYDHFKQIPEMIFKRSTRITKEEVMLLYHNEIPDIYAQVFDKQGYYVYDGYFADDCGPTEAFLCNIDLNIDTEDFIMRHESRF